MSDQLAIQFDYRSDSGPRLVGPFPDRDAAEAWVTRQVDLKKFSEAAWGVVRLASPEAP
jgi:hypothetical protein